MVYPLTTTLNVFYDLLFCFYLFFFLFFLLLKMSGSLFHLHQTILVSVCIFLIYFFLLKTFVISWLLVYMYWENTIFYLYLFCLFKKATEGFSYLSTIMTIFLWPSLFRNKFFLFSRYCKICYWIIFTAKDLFKYCG